MAKQVNIGALLRKHLGKEVGDAMAAKINKMLSEKKSAAQIEKVIQADLAAHVEKGVTAAVITKIGPMIPIKVKPIQTDIKSNIRPIRVSAELGPALQHITCPPLKGQPIGTEVTIRPSARAPK
ncbi:MAG: hypothetical protein ACLQGV_09875 [Bryobacteraceae bacterium]